MLDRTEINPVRTLGSVVVLTIVFIVSFYIMQDAPDDILSQPMNTQSAPPDQNQSVGKHATPKPVTQDKYVLEQSSQDTKARSTQHFLDPMNDHSQVNHHGVKAEVGAYLDPDSFVESASPYPAISVYDYVNPRDTTESESTVYQHVGEYLPVTHSEAVSTFSEPTHVGVFINPAEF
ncbi:MAG: hypothetical protein RJQ07_07195 [Pseudomonadales bacterium]